MNRPALLCCLLLIACAPAPAAAPPVAPVAAAPGFEWPAQPGWRKETIPFPLEFAPELPYRGVEELRFAPGFFDARSPGFWSYGFVWFLEGTPDTSPAAIARELRRYFQGLCGAVAKGKYTFDAERIGVTLERAPNAPDAIGEARVFDAFKTGQELLLKLRMRTLVCPQAKRTAVLIVASPRPWSDAIWKQIEVQARAFSCR